MPQTALITGGSRGLGLETAKVLAGRGYRVFVGVRSERAGEDAVRAIAASITFTQVPQQFILTVLQGWVTLLIVYFS